MNCLACATSMPSDCAKPRAPCPYTIPKFTALARERISSDTASGSTPRIRAAVRR